MWGKKQAVKERKEHKVRQSERVSLALPIEISGKDFFGDPFQCEGSTEVISQHGARIRLARKLAPGQGITIRCAESEKKATARVVAGVNGKSNGHANGKSKDYVYGVMIEDPHLHPWGINFPPRGDSAGAVGRIILECLSCHTRDLGYLDGFELEVLESNGTVSRFCRRCLETSVWKKSFDSLPPVSAARKGAPKNENGNGHTRERRRQSRHEVRIIACVRTQQSGIELVKVRNVSRIGLCFEGHRTYEMGLEIQIAIPYSSGGGNVFVPAKIARLQPVSSGGFTLYGVEYMRRK